MCDFRSGQGSKRDDSRTQARVSDKHDDTDKQRREADDAVVARCQEPRDNERRGPGEQLNPPSGPTNPGKAPPEGLVELGMLSSRHYFEYAVDAALSRSKCVPAALSRTAASLPARRSRLNSSANADVTVGSAAFLPAKASKTADSISRAPVVVSTHDRAAYLCTRSALSPGGQSARIGSPVARYLVCLRSDGDVIGHSLLPPLTEVENRGRLHESQSLGVSDAVDQPNRNTIFELVVRLEDRPYLNELDLWITNPSQRLQKTIRIAGSIKVADMHNREVRRRAVLGNVEPIVPVRDARHL